jgi:hypothetical protein
MAFPVFKADYPRVYLKDGKTLLWPNRNLGDHYRVGRIAEEVEAALTTKRAPQPKSQPQPQPQRPDGTQYTYREAAVILGISEAAVFKRVRKYGWNAALARGDAHGHRRPLPVHG